MEYRTSIKFGDKLNLAKLANHYQIAKLKFRQHFLFVSDTLTATLQAKPSGVLFTA